MAAGMPHDPALDRTLALGRDPYHWISRRARELGSDVFLTRLLLQPTICLTGHDAARLFHDEARFRRHDAAPARLVQSLFGPGGVQTLDDAAHKRRKAMFLSMMTPERVEALATLVTGRLRAHAQQWRLKREVTLWDAFRPVLCEAVHEWSGLPLGGTAVAARTRDLTALFDGAGAVGPRHWAARRARARATTWASAAIAQVRGGRLRPSHDRAAWIIAHHTGEDGALLPLPVAATELLNVLRPTVAIAVYLVFTALALHQHASSRARIAAGDTAYLHAFVQEVRRFYPFFPATAARVRTDFTWQGHVFPAGRRVLLDLHGINHDPRLWEAPTTFRPERFLDHEPDPFTLVPQGGGVHAAHHRCPGEWVTIAVMAAVARVLVTELAYDVPPQRLELALRRLPALPRSGFVVRRVRAVT